LAGAYTYAIGIMLVDRLEQHGKFELPHLKKLVAE
jgi:hypothetical protein